MLDPTPDCGLREPDLPVIEAPAEPIAVKTTPPPRLSLVHLLVGVTCCGVYLALVRGMFAAEPGLLGVMLLALHGLTAAAAWTCLAIFVARQVRGANWPIEAGQWLGATLGLRLALEGGLTWLSRDVFRSPEAVLDVLTSCVLVVPLLSRRIEPRWKTLFFLLLLLYGAPLALGMAGWAAAWLILPRPFGVMVLLGSGVLLDGRAGASRTWLHWLGLAAWLLHIITALLLL